MLTVFEVKGSKYVKLSEFYDLMELSKKEYHSFVRRNIVDHSIPIKTIDFLAIEPKKHGIGRPRMDFLISLDFLKTLCFEIRSVKSKQIKTWVTTITDFTVIP